MNINFEPTRTSARPMPKPMILIIGFIFFATGIFFTYKSIHNGFALRTKTTGTIVKVDVTTERVNKGSSKHKKYKLVNNYQPTISYTIDGKTYENLSSLTSVDESEYKVGDSIAIKYNEKNPSEFEIVGKGTRANLIFAVMGILAGLLCIFAFIRT